MKRARILAVAWPLAAGLVLMAVPLVASAVGGGAGGWVVWTLSAVCWGAGALLVGLKLYRPLLRVRRALDGARADAARASLGQSVRGNPLAEELMQLVSTIERQYEQEYTLEMLKKEAELRALQSQINPHFLYNTLDSIRGRLIGEGLRQESQIVEALSNLFRYSINPNAVYNTLYQELENVENYMRIIRYRFGDRLSFAREIDDESGIIYHCELPKLTLQPLVENAIQHGMERRASGGLVTVRASISQMGLHICVQDNGGGVEAEKLDQLNRMFRTGAPVQSGSEGGGIALVNVSERIRMRYGEPYGLIMYSGEGLGTQVHILLPVQLMPDPARAAEAGESGG